MLRSPTESGVAARGLSLGAGPPGASAMDVLEIRKVCLALGMDLPPAEQKRWRDKMRALGFYVSDFHGGSEGFSDRDLDRLIERGAIEVVDLPSAGGAANKAAEPENEITTARSGAAGRVRSRNSSKATSERATPHRSIIGHPPASGREGSSR